MSTLRMCVRGHLAISATRLNDMLGHDPGAHETVLRNTHEEQHPRPCPVAHSRLQWPGTCQNATVSAPGGRWATTTGAPPPV